MNTHARKQSRTLRADLSRLQTSAESAAGKADRLLRDVVSAAPALTVGTAAGIGFLIGGGLPPGSFGLLLGVGARMTGAWLQREFLQRTGMQE
jgi:hypothetical protein